MNINSSSLMLSLLLGASFSVATAQTGAFDSGSDGSDGALNVTENITLQLPPDGILNYTTINVASGTTLKIGRNGLNTPVYLLASGDVTIVGTIDVSGTPGTNSAGGFGGPGGWSGGSPGVANNPAGEGQGPGGGKVGTLGNYEAHYSTPQQYEKVSGGGAYGSAPSFLPHGKDNLGKTYGSALLIPLMGGSGGAGALAGNHIGGGGGGGGAILIASNTKISVTGSILANGGSGGAFTPQGYYPQPGSGGAIRLVAPELTGSGSLRAQSGDADQGGYGRIRLDTSVYGGTFDMTYAAVTIGFNPIIFPTNAPELRLKNVAGTEVPADNQNAIVVTLPADGNPVQPVSVDAKNFQGNVKYVVSVVPERGSSTLTEGTITGTGNSTVTGSVNVTFPLNASSQVYVWTKQLVAADATPAP